MVQHFSYETPVAGHTILDGYFKTDTYYSRTTSKHIVQYLKHADSYVKTVTNDYIVRYATLKDWGHSIIGYERQFLR